MDSTAGSGGGAHPPVNPGKRGRIDIDTVTSDHSDIFTGDKYSQYIQYVERQRDSFMREVASTRSKARWLVWLGLAGVIAGLGTMLWIFAGYFDAFAEIFRHMDDPVAAQQAFQAAIDASFGLQFLGVNAIVLSVGVGSIGGILLVVGIVLHVVATARKKRVDRDLAVPPPWTFPHQ